MRLRHARVSRLDDDRLAEQDWRRRILVRFPLQANDALRTIQKDNRRLLWIGPAISELDLHECGVHGVEAHTAQLSWCARH